MQDSISPILILQICKKGEKTQPDWARRNFFRPPSRKFARTTLK